MRYSNFVVYDGKEKWHGPILKAAARRGYRARRIKYADELLRNERGLGFARPSDHPGKLGHGRQVAEVMSKQLVMIQDPTQIHVYENKSAQLGLWHEWMPRTWVFTKQDEALEFVETWDRPQCVVSKANEGSSSQNVRVMPKRDELAKHVIEAFGPGIPLSKGGRQLGYVMLQEFIPHTITWRVNLIGHCRAVFKRYCYPDRPVAQTGNVEPVMEMNSQIESLFEYVNALSVAIGSKWVALDILQVPGVLDQWRLLETSLAWPWPSPGQCNDAPFFGHPTHRWAQMWELLLDEVEAGTW